MVAGPNTTHGTVFPSESEVVWRTISSAIHLLGVSVLAYCFARRTDKLSARGFTSVPIARWLALLIFADSWLFLFSAGLLISGIGLSLNEHACSAGIFLCIILYALSKLFIYWFLVEKVHLVHPHPAGSHSRLKSPAYRLCILFVFGYLAIIILMITGRISFIRTGNQMGLGTTYDQAADGACVIGLGRAASMSILIYDLILNVFFTCLFLYPLYKTVDLSPVLKVAARRTLIAATVSLFTSIVNVAVLTALHGQELGWICLASCAADVAVNAMAIFAVTASFEDHAESERISTFKEGDQNIGSRFSGIGRILVRRPSPRSHLPIVNPDANAPARGILEKSDRSFQTTDVGSSTSTRSVHFSPETAFQSRSFAVAELREHGDDSFESIGMVEKGPVYSTPLASDSNLSEEEDHGSSTLGSEYRGGPVRVSRVGRREPSDPLQQQLPGRPFSVMSLPSIPGRPADPGEDTSVEVRHEGPLTKRLPARRFSLISPPTPMTPWKRSRSTEPNEGPNNEHDGGRDESTSSSLSQSPSTLEEARDRILVLSALTEIAGGKRNSQTDQGSLKVSVVTQVDQRIERRKRSREEMLYDYYGRHYVRRGRSFSSSGGL